MDYNVKLNLGIGDILFSRAILDNQKNNFEKFIISPNLDSYNWSRRPTFEDIEFTLNFFKLVFNKPHYVIDGPNKDYPLRYLHTFTSLDGFDMIKPSLADDVCEGKPLDIGKYLILNMRIKELPLPMFAPQSKEFFDVLNKLSNKYKIVLVGERKIPPWPENNIYVNMKGGSMYSIYEDIINNIPKENIVDLTYDNYDDITDKLKDLRQMFVYLRDAYYNITLGCGGGFCQALAVGNVIGVYPQHNTFDDDGKLRKYEYEHIHLYNNMVEFIEKLKSI